MVEDDSLKIGVVGSTPTGRIYRTGHTMQYQEIMQQLRDGKITLDFCGHSTNITVERMIERYEDVLAHANGSNDGKWSNRNNNPVEEIDADIRGFYQRMLEDNSPNPLMSDGHYCFKCGRNMKWELSGDKLLLTTFWGGDNYQTLPVCECAEPKTTKGVLKVNSKLIFANFFRDIPDGPEDKEHDWDWSLNCDRGCRNIAEYKLNQRNVAYGQMGNMSVGIFVHPSNESIIVGNPYIADSLCENMTEEECDAVDYDALSIIDGHKMVGTISLAVWRWEASDLNTIGDTAFKAIQDDPYNDVVVLDVPHGEWDVEQFYNLAPHENEFIYATLKKRA